MCIIRRGGNMYLTENTDYEIKKAIMNLKEVEFFINGRSKNISKSDKEFSTIYNKIVDILKSSRLMPAYSVSLHDETIKARKSGVWVELHFEGEQVINELPFESLLFKVEKTSGINLIRNYLGRYEGRAIYLALEEEIDILKIINI